MRLRHSAGDWRCQAEATCVRLRDAQDNELAVVAKVSEAEQRASHAEGAVVVLRDQAARAVEAEQRASASEAQAARAEGRAEVLRDLHSNLPRMICAVAAQLKKRDAAARVAISDVKRELLCSPMPGKAHSAQEAIAVEDIAGGLSSRRSTWRRTLEMSAELGSRSVCSGQTFNDPVRMLAEMSAGGIRGMRSS